MDRTFDLVLFGATGFTGRLVAEHLAARAPATLRWALAGRNQGKLDDIRRALGLPELPLVDADVGRTESLEALARSARVVCTTVGPYSLHGSGLVAACAAAGTHYCDLTGEAPWVRRMVDLHHDEARRTGARIVNCCGYDCIPADLGLLVLQDHAIARHGRPASRVTHYIGPVRGGASGGTIASALQMFAEAEADPAVREILADPYSLNPPGERQGPDGADRRGVTWDDAVGKWTAPSVMAVIDNRLVRRSHALRGYPYGKDFRWEEVMTLPKGPGGAIAGAVVAGGLAVAPLVLGNGTLRRAIGRRVTQPGAGPDAATRASGFFKARVLGTGVDRDGRPFTVHARVEGRKDPGYGATSFMLGESALCLALDPLEGPGGLLTPASAMGAPLVRRLREVGLVLEAGES